MPPKKGTSTPNNLSYGATWALNEAEEICKDINDLQNKVVTKDELQGMMDLTKSKMETIMDTNMDVLKGEIMEGLKKVANREAT
jgi:hypothetical protein